MTSIFKKIMDFIWGTGSTGNGQSVPTPQAANNSGNTMTGGGGYNPQVQGVNIAGGGNINMGPKIDHGGSYTINSLPEEKEKAPPPK